MFLCGNLGRRPKLSFQDSWFTEIIGPDVLQLLKMDWDRQQPDSLERERLINCSSVSQAFPARIGNIEPSQKENMADVGNKEQQ